MTTETATTIKTLNAQARAIIASMTDDETMRGHGPKHTALAAIRREVTGLYLRASYGLA